METCLFTHSRPVFNFRSVCVCVRFGEAMIWLVSCSDFSCILIGFGLDLSGCDLYIQDLLALFASVIPGKATKSLISNQTSCLSAS